MTIPRGWQFFMHPGPTNIPERVRQAMARPAVDFTAPYFVALRNSACTAEAPAGRLIIGFEQSG